MPDEDLIGGYDTVGGIKERAEALGKPWIADMIDLIEETIEPVDDGYSIEGFLDVSHEYGDVGSLFYLGVLTGTALEREYPSSEDAPRVAMSDNLRVRCPRCSAENTTFHIERPGVSEIWECENDECPAERIKVEVIEWVSHE